MPPVNAVFYATGEWCLNYSAQMLAQSRDSHLAMGHYILLMPHKLRLTSKSLCLFWSQHDVVGSEYYESLSSMLCHNFHYTLA